MNMPGHSIAAQRHIDLLIKRRNHLMRLAETEKRTWKIDELRAEVSAINSVLSELLSLRTKFEQGRADQPGRVINVEQLTKEEIAEFFPKVKRFDSEILSSFAIHGESSQVEVIHKRVGSEERVQVRRLIPNESAQNEKGQRVAGITFSVAEAHEILTILQNLFSTSGPDEPSE